MHYGTSRENLKECDAMEKGISKEEKQKLQAYCEEQFIAHNLGDMSKLINFSSIEFKNRAEIDECVSDFKNYLTLRKEILEDKNTKAQ